MLDFKVEAFKLLDDEAVLAEKNTETTPLQVAENKLKELDNLHEQRSDGISQICAECWMNWPCATHQIIHNEGADCVHGV